MENKQNEKDIHFQNFKQMIPGEDGLDPQKIFNHIKWLIPQEDPDAFDVLKKRLIAENPEYQGGKFEQYLTWYQKSAPI